MDNQLIPEGRRATRGNSQAMIQARIMVQESAAATPWLTG
jgi:hypothetical protein